MNQNDLERILALVGKKQSFSICLPIRPSLDGVAAATALYVALSKLGKQVILASAQTNFEDYDLVAVEKITNSIFANGDNLVVSFPYKEGAIDKVTYNIEGEQFNLVIQPKEGFEKLNPKDVNYSYSGGSVDAFIVIDSPNLESLGELYTTNKDSFNGVEIVSIDRHMNNNSFGSINLILKQSSSLSEAIFTIIQALRIELDRDTATNLYTGIVGATNNFSSYAVSADTLEIAAKLLRAGAVKTTPMRSPADRSMGMSRPFVPSGASGQPFEQPTRPVGQPMMGNSQPRSPLGPDPLTTSQPQPAAPAWFDMLPEEEEEDEFVEPMMPPAGSQPASTPQIKTQPKEKAAERPQDIEGKEGKGEEEATPNDWLKPKIFKGGGLI